MIDAATDTRHSRDRQRQRYQNDRDFVENFLANQKVEVKNYVNVDRSGNVDVRTQTQRTANYAY